MWWRECRYNTNTHHCLLFRVKNLAKISVSVALREKCFRFRFQMNVGMRCVDECEKWKSFGSAAPAISFDTEFIFLDSSCVRKSSENVLSLTSSFVADVELGQFKKVWYFQLCVFKQKSTQHTREGPKQMQTNTLRVNLRNLGVYQKHLTLEWHLVKLAPAGLGLPGGCVFEERTTTLEGCHRSAARRRCMCAETAPRGRRRQGWHFRRVYV